MIHEDLIHVEANAWLTDLKAKHTDPQWYIYGRAEWFVRESLDKRGYQHPNLARIKELMAELKDCGLEDKQQMVSEKLAHTMYPKKVELTPAPAPHADLIGEAPTPELSRLKEIARHCWRGVHWSRSPSEAPRCVREPLKISHLEAHLDAGPYVGLAPITPGTSTTQVAVLDLDDHGGAFGWEKMVDVAKRIAVAFPPTLRPHLFRSSGGKGIHIYLLWSEQQDAYSVRTMLAELLQSVGLKPGTKGVEHNEVELFPKQDSVAADGVGSMFILPFANKSVALDAQGVPTDTIPPLIHSEPIIKREHPVVERNTTTARLDTDELKHLQQALNAISNEGDALDYDSWRDIIFGVHHATGGSAEGQQLALEFSRRSSKHDEEFFNNRVWPYIKSERENPITAATIFAKARENGYNEALSFFDDISGGTPEPNNNVLPFTKGATPGAAVEAKPKTNEELYSLLSVDDLRARPDPEWLIYGVLPKAGLIVLYGESTAGKSFIALDFARAIVTGAPWFGNDSRQGRVVYICAEGMGGFKLRVLSLERGHSLECNALDDLRVLADVPNFLTLEDVRKTIKTIQSFSPTVLVIVDTLAQVSAGANENSGEDMGKVVGYCRAIHEITGSTVLLVHHSGKDLTKGARGWSGLKAATDAELETSRQGEYRQVRVSKLKDGMDGAVYPFRLRPAPTGRMDENGNVIESCVVEPLAADAVAAAQAAFKTKKGPKLRGKWQNAVFKIVRDAQKIDGLGVSKAEVLKMVADAAATEAVEDFKLEHPDSDAKAREDHHKKEYKRARDSAREALDPMLEDDAGPLAIKDGLVTLRYADDITNPPADEAAGLT
jgi:hypothetical protein